MTFSVSKRVAERLAKNVGAEPPPPPTPPRPRRITLDERLCIAGWMPRFRVCCGHDFWNPYTNESAGVAESYMDARALALARIRRENAAPVE